ncbi:probable L-type lectin-domain containing receptor kinase S.5 [Diospyros lotus]|uniref:probable L-type lectin-domain containing receptor kinase S.5 n=1 Tax=Diospyros lotus TaxID=55363 RepID=UPI0022580F43|nr:probable L-type lectin-domain containing receptor kinase S.5 [Diospyros lotus]
MLLVFILWGMLFPSSSFSCMEPFNVSFPSFDSGSCSKTGNLICMGSVSVGNGSLSITPPDPSTPVNQIGRVLYHVPVLAWPAYICTTFTIRILVEHNASIAGDGMAFVLAQDSNPSPSKSFGSYMGVFDQSTQGVLRQLAVEFDTYKNEDEPDANHIAIDTVSIEEPVAFKSLNGTGIQLKSGREITVMIEYDGWSKRLQIYVAYAGEPLASFLNHTMKLQHTVPSNVYMGFTAATGTLRETHQILSWNFTTARLPKESLEEKPKMFGVVYIIIGAVLLLAAIVATPFILTDRKSKMERIARKDDIEALIAVANGPKLFSYRQLSEATRNFRKENLLGTGGFGSVYKGVVSKSNPPTTIAVKKISSTSKQGEKEYLAEICTIGRLRHKNIVQLQGWCHDRDQLLLVYEYMPNGSLDRFIGKDEFLDWPTRHKVLVGLASALVYLHEECGNPVVHRDVKPNNVMLDGDYNAHLGDFGLARLLLQDAASVTTMIAGTPGYLAPEVSFTGRATPESDVYSFGMVVLELVCGKRSRGIMDENSLVDSVWDLQETGALLNCVDKQLQGQKYNEEQVKRALLVGLACLHPDFMLRPRMRKVVHIFMNPDEPLMELPETRQSAVRLSFRSSFATTTTTTDLCSNCTNTGSCGGYTESLPDETEARFEL